MSKTRLLAVLAAVAVLAGGAWWLFASGDEQEEPLTVTVDAPATPLRDLSGNRLDCAAVRTAAALPDVAEMRDLPDGSCSWRGELTEVSGNTMVLLRYENSGGTQSWDAHVAGLLTDAQACGPSATAIPIKADAYAHKTACHYNDGNPVVHMAIATESFVFSATVRDLTNSASDRSLAEAATGILERAVDETLRAVS